MLLDRVRDALWGTPTLLLLLGFGLYFTLRLGLWKPAKLAYAFKHTFFAGGKKAQGNNLSSFSALATALGGTVGVGSISGVALAISVGGAGSIFWMWVCSVLGLGLKYAEVALCHARRKSTKRGFTGGAMYCLQDLGYRRLAVLFALFCVASAVAGGSVVQAGAVAYVLSPKISSVAVRGALIWSITLIIICGGRKRIAKVNEAVLPIVSALFVLSTVYIIGANAKMLPSAFGQIFGEAFGFKQAAGGIGGATMMRVGCVRGSFSHEAGMGSSPISYAAATENDSHIQGLWGVTEVFVDSFVVSTLTALALLCTKAARPEEMFYALFGNTGTAIYGVALGFFAFAAIISWCFYGEEALAFLMPDGKRCFAVFRIFVAFGAAMGAVLSESAAFAAADIWGVLMMFINLFLLYKTRSDIIAMAKQKRG
ncbi:MAG: alanine:cation symporter family protein [Ruminococcaceae bacterium]|nr:alanine:cation symporter family protein [Oscillospiraceae bacterium]